MPYKGIVPYSEEDAPFFFGREADCSVIIDNLSASRFTLLYGASGVGKSSLLRAGVAHRLRRQARQSPGELGAPETAVVVFSSWRDDPVVGLAAEVQAAVASELGGPAIPPSASARSLVDVLKIWSERF